MLLKENYELSMNIGLFATKCQFDFGRNFVDLRSLERREKNIIDYIMGQH